MQSQLGQMAVGLALSFNEQHKLGLDQNGNPGGDYFSIGQPQGVPNAQNKSNAQISGTFGTVGNINAKDYDITFDGTNYMVTRLPRARRSITVRPRRRRPTRAGPGRRDGRAPDDLRAAAERQVVAVAGTTRRDLNGDHRSQQDRPGRHHGQRQWQERPEAGAAADGQVLDTQHHEMFSRVVNTVGVQTQQIKSAATRRPT